MVIGIHICYLACLSNIFEMLTIVFNSERGEGKREE